ncbi:MAG TPA: RNA degradosome polyphosphate kinase, partial [Nitrospiria bacterium]|nr:RNA degradosome polyphosphate kinase [Nitrospiria bacterium]
RKFRKLLPSPTVFKQALLSKIDREIAQHSEGSPGLIQFKVNALEDKEITRALYRASQAGVKVDLIVRDTCRLRPGIPGLSETIRVVSVVGRFLEHGRIYYFRNGGNEEYFISSADCMSHKLQHRIEVAVPVEGPELREQLRQILEIQLTNRASLWAMQSDGTYVRSEPETGAETRGAQELMIERAQKRFQSTQQSSKQSHSGKTQGRTKGGSPSIPGGGFKGRKRRGV